MTTVQKNTENFNAIEPETEQEDQDDDNELLALSPEAAAALRAFALSSGVAIDTSNNHEGQGNNDLLSAVRDHFDLKERDETFVVEYQDNDNDDDTTTNITSLQVKRNIRFEVQGVKRVLGQTLSSTGLTIWRAAEHLCDYMFHNPARFQQRTVCELVSTSDSAFLHIYYYDMIYSFSLTTSFTSTASLHLPQGCGLGMVSILLHKMSVAKSILATGALLLTHASFYPYHPAIYTY